MGKIGSRRKGSFMVQDSGVHGGGNTRRTKEAGLGWEYSPSEGQSRARTRRGRVGRGREAHQQSSSPGTSHSGRGGTCLLEGM